VEMARCCRKSDAALCALQLCVFGNSCTGLENARAGAVWLAVMFQ
jgi:hypothetical protein